MTTTTKSETALLRSEGATRALWALFWTLVRDMDSREKRNAIRVAEVTLEEIRSWIKDDHPTAVDPVTLQASAEQLEEVVKRLHALNAEHPSGISAWLRSRRKPPMQTRTIELYHPNVNGGEPVSMVVQMTRIYCSPPDRIGMRKMDDIDIVVPLRSDEQRLLHEFEKAIIRGPSGILPMRLVADDHVGGWSIVSHTFEGKYVRYSLIYSGRHPNPPSVAEDQ